MQQIFTWIFVLLLARLSAAEVAKGVVFEEREFEFSAGLSEAVMEFDLPFTNHTDKLVNVTSVEASCSCIKVAPVDKQVEPGATSRVHGVVNIPNGIGPIRKLVILKTDAPGGMSVVRVKIEIPSMLNLTPERLIWTIDAAPDEKTLRIKIADSVAPVNITKVEGPGDSFEWSLKTIREGREYELVIHPKSTANLTVGLFQIHTDSTVPRHQRLGFQVVIEPAIYPAR